jgi:hypothetical protein
LSQQEPEQHKQEQQEQEQQTSQVLLAALFGERIRRTTSVLLDTLDASLAVTYTFLVHINRIS